MKTALAALALTALLFPLQSDKRIVLLFSATDNPQLLRQVKELNTDPEGIAQRDILIKSIEPDGQGKGLYKKHKVQDAPFTFILIGKDGGEKLRSTSVVTTQTLFGVIDKMPMRRSEMRNKH